jgi:hypothetical protein
LEGCYLEGRERDGRIPLKWILGEENKTSSGSCPIAGSGFRDDDLWSVTTRDSSLNLLQINIYFIYDVFVTKYSFQRQVHKVLCTI